MNVYDDKGLMIEPIMEFVLYLKENQYMGRKLRSVPQNLCNIFIFNEPLLILCLVKKLTGTVSFNFYSCRR